MNFELIANAAPTIAIILFVFVLIREVVCWYFKINERVKLKEKILNELIKLNVKVDNKSTHHFIDKDGDSL